MGRGGKRANAGRKNSWNTEESSSKVIRVPDSMADVLSKIKEKYIPVNRINTALEAVLRLSK